MKVFDSLAKCGAYELTLLRPLRWPPTTYPVPTLWERAKSLFGDMLSKVGAAMTVAYRHAATRKQRRELVMRLEPIEKLVRHLLCIEAITFLLMTPEGLKLRQTTKQVVPPPPPPPFRKPEISPERARFHAALMTIDALRPKTDPRVAEREERERLAGLAACDPFDVKPLDGRFRVLRWNFPDDPERHAARANGKLPFHAVLDAPLTVGDMRDALAPGAGEGDANGDLRGPMLSLARRMDALERVIANPGPTIRRLAARIAAMPRACFEAPTRLHWLASRWWHGAPEYYNAVDRAKSAFAALDRAYALPPDDPG